MVLVSGDGANGLAALALFLAKNEVTTVPFDDSHRRLATAAFVRYGKGRHSAALNYGDCMTYATARLSGAPLLFVGEDFAKTDLAAALA
jgi:ribonuclease VapC